MAGGGGSGEKTEKATPKKRRDERKKGNVMMSRDVVAVVTLFASYVALRFGLPIIADSLTYITKYFLGLIGSLPTGGVNAIMPDITSESVMALTRSVALPLMATAFATIIATFAQTRLLVSFESIKPKFSKLNPLEGIKKLVSLKSAIEVIKSTIKITVLLVLIYMFVRDSIVHFTQLLHADITVSATDIKYMALNLLLQVGMAFIVVSFFDYLYQWWDFERQLKMTKQEVKEEYKQIEGDPQIKAKIKEAQRKMSQSRMMQAVPEADVVIRNPTHFAVALRYKPQKDLAPIVVAKGQDELALRIVKVAEENGVAVMENRPLARALYADSEIGMPIPYEHYGAVAEVLVYIYKLNNKLPPQ